MKKILLITLVAFGMNVKAANITSNKDSVCLHSAVTFTFTASDTSASAVDTIAVIQWVIGQSGDTLYIYDTISAQLNITDIITHTFTLPGVWTVLARLINQNNQYIGGYGPIGIMVMHPTLSVTVQGVSCGRDGSINVNQSFYNYLWSNGQTTESISGLGIGTYSVVVTDMFGCTASDTSIVVSASGVEPIPPICMVTVDSLSQYNVIIWDKTSFAPTDSFIVYREIGTNNYQPIGTVSYNSQSLFKDTMRTKYFPNTGDPNAGTYRYKLGLRDSCGSISTLSPYHNTIYMLNNSGAFSWSQLYTIEGSSNPVISYILMRDDNTTGNWHAVNSVSGTQQTVVDPAYLTYENTASWKIITQWNITCIPTIIKNPIMNSFIASQSNIYKVVGASVNELTLDNSIHIYPNPTSGVFRIVAPSLKGENNSIEIYNLLGEKIFAEEINKSTLQGGGQIALPSELVQGIYFLQLKTEQGTATKKLVINK